MAEFVNCSLNYGLLYVLCFTYGYGLCYNKSDFHAPAFFKDSYWSESNRRIEHFSLDNC